MSRSKLFRLYCLLLVVLFSFTIFGLSGSAAEEVASDSVIVGSDVYYNLEKRVNVYPDFSYIKGHIHSPGSTPIYDICIKPESDFGLRLGLFYSLSGLVAGDSYTFNCSILSYQQYNDAVAGSTLSSSYYDFFNKRDGNLIIGVGSVASNGDFTFSDIGISITKDNYLDYFGSHSSFTFVLPNLVNPAIGIYYIDCAESGNATHLYFQDVYLDNNCYFFYTCVEFQSLGKFGLVLNTIWHFVRAYFHIENMD